MKDPKPTLFDVPPAKREQIRHAILALREAGQRVSVRAVAREAHVRQATASVFVQAVRQEQLSLVTAWDDTLCEDDMVRRIEQATTDAQRAQLCIDISKGIYLGQIPATVGRAMGAMIGEARLCGRNASESEGEDALPTFLLSRAAITLGRLLDGILSEQRRSEAIAYVEALFHADLEEHPNPTLEEVEALRAEARS